MAQRLREVEVVAVFLRTFLFRLRLHHLRRDDRLALKHSAHGTSDLFVLIDGFGYDIFGTLQGIRRRLYVTLDEAFRLTLRVVLALQEDKLCQRFQSLLTSDVRLRASFGLVRQIDVLQLRHIPALVNASAQLVSHLSEVLNSGYDGLLALLDVHQLLPHQGDVRHLHLVQSSRPLLAVTAA